MIEGKQLLLAKTYAGLEDVLASELTAMGAQDIKAINRGVLFSGTKETIYAANLRLRTATRVLVKWKEYELRSEPHYFEIIKSLDWSGWMGLKDSFAVDILLMTDVFKRQGQIAEHTKEAIAETVRRKTGRRPNVNEERPDIRIHIHVYEKELLIYLDSSGQPLTWRGWRKGKTDGRINDVLVAGAILMSGWKGKPDWIDLDCGGGQAVIEASMISKSLAPGMSRDQFSFQRWQGYDADLFKKEKVRATADAQHMEGNVTGWTKSMLDQNASKRNMTAAGVLSLATVEKVNAVRQSAPEKPSQLFLKVEEPETFKAILQHVARHFKGCKLTLVGMEGDWANLLPAESLVKGILLDGNKRVLVAQLEF